MNDCKSSRKGNLDQQNEGKEIEKEIKPRVKKTEIRSYICVLKFNLYLFL